MRVEEWLGRNTEAYYSILAKIGEGHWNPKRDALDWVQFCLVAHYQQAATLMRRNTEFSRMWSEVEKFRTVHGLPERMDIALMDAAFGYKVRNNRYRQENDISDVVASRDFKRLCEVGLLVPVGEKRGRYYEASEVLKAMRNMTRHPVRVPNPYDLVRAKGDEKQLALTF